MEKRLEVMEERNVKNKRQKLTMNQHSQHVDTETHTQESFKGELYVTAQALGTKEKPTKDIT